MKKYDVVIIGSGIAGMSAAIYLKRNNKSVLVIENDTPGGQLNRSSLIENYPGYVSISGPDLACNIYNQVSNLNIDYYFGDIKEISFDKNTIYTDEEVIYKYLIIATGRSPRKLDILNDYIGNGVSYCAICDGSLYKNKDVLVIGGGNTAFNEAIYLSKICNSVKIFNRNDLLRADFKEIEDVKKTNNIEVILNEFIRDIIKKDKFIINNKYYFDGIFVCIGYVPNSKLFDVEKDNDYIVVDSHFKTNIDNVYAVGDVIKKDVYQLVTASSEGAISALDIINRLN